MDSLAEMECKLTIERPLAGLEVFRQFGRKGGRKRKMTDISCLMIFEDY